MCTPGTAPRDLPIEIDESRFSGIVRRGNYPGEILPDLIAHRPEPGRFWRMARVIGAARSIAARELGSDDAGALVDAMVSMSDLKGDFTLVWRQSAHRPVFETIVTRALKAEGEDEILHEIDPGQ